MLFIENDKFYFSREKFESWFYSINLGDCLTDLVEFFVLYLVFCLYVRSSANKYALIGVFITDISLIANKKSVTLSTDP